MDEFQDHYRAMVERIPEAVFVLDAQGTFRFMNDSAADQVGGHPGDFVGKSLHDIFPHEIAARFAENARQVIQSGTGMVTITQQPLRQGLRWHRTAIEPLRDSSGQVTAALLIARDITDWKLAEEQRQEAENRYRTLVEQLPAITYTGAVDHTSTILYISPQLTELLGFTFDDCRNIPDLWIRQLHPEDRDRVHDELARGLQAGHHFVSEYRLIAKNGTVKWFRDEANIVRAPDGRPLRLQGVMLDITEEKSALEAARRSNELFHELFACSPIGMALHDARGKLVSANPALRQILGLSEVRQNRSFELLSDPQLPAAVRASLQAGDPVRFEAAYDFDRVRRERLHDTSRTGIAHLDTLITPLTDAHTGQRTGFLVQIQDITERKHAEADVNTLSAQRQFALDAARLGWWHYDPLTGIVSWDDRYQAIFQMAGRQAHGDELLAHVHPDDLPHVRAAVAAASDPDHPRPYSIQYRIRLPDGAQRWVETFGIAAFEGTADARRPLGLFGTVCDITERKHAEEALRRSEQHAHERSEELQTLMDMVPLAILVAHDPRCARITGNRTANLLFEAQPRENISVNPAVRSPLNVRRFLRNGRELSRDELPLQLAATTGTDLHDFEMDAVLPSGRTLALLGSACPLRGADGRVRGAISAFLDISDRKRSETSLRESRQEFEDLLRSMEDGVWAATMDGKYLYLNPAMERIYGRTHAEFRADTGLWCDVVHPDDQPLARESSARLLDLGHADLEYRIVRPDGAVRWLRDRKTIVRDSQGRPLRIGGIIRDITTRRLAAQQADQYRTHLKSLATELTLAEERERRRLAANVHDNLTQILGLIQIKLSLLQGAKAVERRALLGELQHLAERSVKASRSLILQLSHPGLYDLGFLAGAEWLAEDIQALYGVPVSVRDDGLPKPLDEPVRVVLFQCLREALANAAKHAHAPNVRVRISRSRGMVRVVVRDRGVGFDLATLAQQPKRGFGIFSIRERVEHLGGRFTVHARPGKGTTVLLTLPLSLPASPAPHPKCDREGA
jgi:PAS domain S-box-containing protein